MKIRPEILRVTAIVIAQNDRMDKADRDGSVVYIYI
jgi:hypothetical protein